MIPDHITLRTDLQIIIKSGGNEIIYYCIT